MNCCLYLATVKNAQILIQFRDYKMLKCCIVCYEKSPRLLLR